MTREWIIETMARAVYRSMPNTGPFTLTDEEKNLCADMFWRSCILKATAALSALEAAGLAVVPGHAMASGNMEESAGKALYEHFAFYPNEQKPAWTPAGNAIRQDDARRLAMAAVNAWLAAAQGAHKP